MIYKFRNFEIGEKIGHGGMASVYRGRHLTLDYPVAIKILHPALTYDKTFLARFEQEARIAASIQNHNIVKVIDFGVENETYFIVMELVEGEDLSRIFSRLAESHGNPSPLPPEICLLILEGVAYGLKASHEKGILHRDIKPSNIMLDHHGLVRVADFGLARNATRSQDLDLTRTGTVLGTPSYMSPEQTAGEKLDSRTDIFSLGVVAYEGLSGYKPFPGETHSEVLQKIIEAEPTPLDSEKLPWITPQVRSLLENSLQKIPDKRFQSMSEYLRAIRLALESIDPKREIVLNQREYLSRFAKDPVSTAEELRNISVKTHLWRGLRFQGMGLDKLQDALFEFRFVQTLDPLNKKAKEAIRELEAKGEESGQKWPSATEKTRVLGDSPDQKTSEMEKTPPTKARVPVWAIFLIVAVLAGGAYLGWGVFRPQDTVEEFVDPILAGVTDSAPAAEDSLEVGRFAKNETDSLVERMESDTELQEEGKPEPEASEEALITPQEKEADPEQALAQEEPVGKIQSRSQPSVPQSISEPVPGHLRFSTAEECRLELEGRIVFEGKGDIDIEFEPGSYWPAICYFPKTFSWVDLDTLTIESGEVRDLRALNPKHGFIYLGASCNVALEIDGRQVFAHKRNLPTTPIGSGVHVLTVRREGYVVDSAESDGKKLRRVSVGNGHSGYQMEIIENEVHRVIFRLRKVQ